MGLLGLIYGSVDKLGVAAVFPEPSKNDRLEMCMRMRKTGIPWVPLDSYGNGNKISRGMGMGLKWELSAWEWELRCGSGENTAYCN